MDGYGTREAAGLLNLSERRIRALVRAGVVTPERGARGVLRFDFRDLVLLRVAGSLIEAGIPAARVTRSLAELRRRLPHDRSLSELRIVADHDRILVYDGSASFDAETGQLVLDFPVSELAARVRPLEPSVPAASASEAEALYAQGIELEDSDPRAAAEAYGRAVELDPTHADALVNLGRLLHEEGRLPEAADCYRRALEAQPAHATAAFNLGIALDDLGDWRGAADANRRAIELQPAFADAYYNLAAVLERLGERQAALRALRRYRELKRRSPAIR